MKNPLPIIALFLSHVAAAQHEANCLKIEEDLYVNALAGNTSDQDKQLNQLKSCNGEAALLKEAKFYLGQKRYEEAIRKCKQFLSGDALGNKEVSEAYYILGLSEYELKKYREALTAFVQAEESGYNNIQTLFQKGRCHYASGDYITAQKRYEEALSLDDQSHVIYNNLGLCHEKSNNHTQALNMYKQADRLANGKEPLYKLNIFNRYYALDDWQNAYVYGQSLYERGSDNPKFAKDYSWVLNKLGKFDEAIAICQKARQQNPNLFNVNFCLGYYFNEKAELDSALFYYHKDLELYPNNKGTLHNISKIYNAVGQFDEAMRYLKLAVQINPNYSNVRGEIIENLLWQHKYEELYEASLDYAKRFPHNKHTPAYMGYALMQLKRYEEAIPYFMEDLQIDPDDSKPYNNMARCYAKLGKHEEALSNFSKALQYDPTNSFIYHNRASLYADLGQYDLACRDLKRALKEEYNWVIDSNLIDLRDKFCPEISLNRELIYYGYKGNLDHLRHKAFIRILPLDEKAFESLKTKMLDAASAPEEQPVSTEEVKKVAELQAFLVYPNPNAGMFYVENSQPAGDIMVKVYNIRGQLVLEENMQRDKMEIDLSQKENGTYIVIISDSREIKYSGKVIIAHP